MSARAGASVINNAGVFAITEEIAPDSMAQVEISNSKINLNLNAFTNSGLAYIGNVSGGYDGVYSNSSYSLITSSGDTVTINTQATSNTGNANVVGLSALGGRTQTSGAPTALTASKGDTFIVNSVPTTLQPNAPITSQGNTPTNSATNQTPNNTGNTVGNAVAVGAAATGVAVAVGSVVTAKVVAANAAAIGAATLGGLTAVGVATATTTVVAGAILLTGVGVVAGGILLTAGALALAITAWTAPPGTTPFWLPPVTPKYNSQVTGCGAGLKCVNGRPIKRVNL